MKFFNVIGKILLGINAACLALVLLIGILTMIYVIAAPEEISSSSGTLSAPVLFLLCVLLLLLPAVLLVINLLGVFTKTHLGVTALLCLPMVLCILLFVISLVPDFRDSFLEGFNEGFRNSYGGEARSEVNGYGIWLMVTIYMVVSYALLVVARLARRFTTGPKQLTQIYQ